MNEIKEAFIRAIAEWEAEGKPGGEFEFNNIRDVFEYVARKAGFSYQEIDEAFSN